MSATETKFNLTPAEERIFRKLDRPAKIQDFLDKLPINFERTGETCRSPRLVLRKERAHCIEGALFAASVLWYHGYKPLLLDLKTTAYDYDHVVALFQRQGYWGAISKSNHAVLLYRDPVYKSIRELVMSYFHEYFLQNREKTLRSYSDPFNLNKFGTAWVTAEKNLWRIATALDRTRHKKILNRGMIKNLRPADKIQIQAGNLEIWK